MTSRPPGPCLSRPPRTSFQQAAGLRVGRAVIDSKPKMLTHLTARPAATDATALAQVSYLLGTTPTNRMKTQIRNIQTPITGPLWGGLRSSPSGERTHDKCVILAFPSAIARISGPSRPTGAYCHGPGFFEHW